MVYGPRQPRSGAYAIVTGVFAGQKERGEELTIEGDGLQFRDFVHVKDIGRGIILAYQNDQVRSGQPINLGSGEAHTVQELADLISSNQRHVPARKNDLRGTLADTCKAKELLGWSTRKNFRDEMRRIIEDTLAGRGLYLSHWFQQAETLEWLEDRIPGFARAGHDERNSMVATELRVHGDKWFEKAPGLHAHKE
ncbi:nad dependent epimerase/dehydratase, putative [Perkinsus marinus ATCC 50983]|uniref:Nad dependent epimerase/dehydratase, putative n=1 Tax=Perkinsus marinus (strain ATCC 50983 / TXsc) TaxID=423536 RepID=C5LTJ7_PERM5|nr:nad dependent epimerase/dehydratase, putative [Perkinsus marinus ATCC 50983]EEQ99947.1 nad dependent epimerase/dehydratase, putative [Perkinsus marinus ATCC 50983]|eukprot:XP_002767230.1 nad dependent epimerase/dehydratase, putative [Perkinsus marinus ATCC 50983]